MYDDHDETMVVADSPRSTNWPKSLHLWFSAATAVSVRQTSIILLNAPTIRGSGGGEYTLVSQLQSRAISAAAFEVIKSFSAPALTQQPPPPPRSPVCWRHHVTTAHLFTHNPPINQPNCCWEQQLKFRRKDLNWQKHCPRPVTRARVFILVWFLSL